MNRGVVSGWLFAVVTLGVGAICVVTADERSQRGSSPAGDSGKAPQKLAAGAAEVPEARSSPDDSAIRALGKAIVLAYQQHHAKSFASVFTAEGEYVDERETLFHGRDAIEEEFTGFFAVNPQASIDLTFDSIRNIAPGVIKAQGVSTFRQTAAGRSIRGRFSLVCAKEGEQWLVASLREMDSNEVVSRHEQLRQLEWMIGDWVSEGPRSKIHFTCHWEHNGNFIVRDFDIRASEGQSLSGTQLIGVDPLTGHLKSWAFDSEGGYSTGDLRRQGDDWVLDSAGVTSVGELASGTEIFTPLDPHRIGWDSVDRNIGGSRLADSGKITIVRQHPRPAANATAPNPKR